jgi:DNA-binding winged helix-turn-helix (wHTH) protein
MAVTVRFGNCWFDGAQRRVTRAGTDVHLTPKAFDLLALLVADAPRVIPKEELHGRLWPESFVSEATLTGLVKEVRRAVDEPGAASCIRTAHGVGYALAIPPEGGPPTTQAGRHWLVFAGRPTVLVAGENLIGRDPSAAVFLDYAGVSRRHARVVLGATGATIEDLGSKNGTRLADLIVTGAVELREGDAIHVGPAVLVYRASHEGPSTETHIGVDAAPTVESAAEARRRS